MYSQFIPWSDELLCTEMGLSNKECNCVMALYKAHFDTMDRLEFNSIVVLVTVG